jgi:hypothetical protein
MPEGSCEKIQIQRLLADFALRLGDSPGRFQRGAILRRAFHPVGAPGQSQAGGSLLAVHVAPAIEHSASNPHLVVQGTHLLPVNESLCLNMASRNSRALSV